MNLNELRPAEGSKKNRKRVGRGHGSGWGKTAGKGHNGQKQRSGSYVSPIFEGGQMPIVRRVPKRGFSNSAFKKDTVVLTLADIVNKFNDGDVISLETLIENGIVKNPKFIVRYSDEGLKAVKGKKAVKKYLEENGYEITSSEFVRIPNDVKEVTPEQRESIEKLIEKLEEDEDVQNVFHNMKEDENGDEE